MKDLVVKHEVVEKMLDDRWPSMFVAATKKGITRTELVDATCEFLSDAMSQYLADVVETIMEPGYILERYVETPKVKECDVCGLPEDLCVCGNFKRSMSRDSTY